MILDDALFTLLLDGLNNRTKEDYLRLHNKIAPYKIALALDYQGEVKKMLHRKSNPLSKMRSVYY